MVCFCNGRFESFDSDGKKRRTKTSVSENNTLEDTYWSRPHDCSLSHSPPSMSCRVRPAHRMRTCPKRVSTVTKRTIRIHDLSPVEAHTQTMTTHTTSDHRHRFSRTTTRFSSVTACKPCLMSVRIQISLNSKVFLPFFCQKKLPSPHMKPDHMINTVGEEEEWARRHSVHSGNLGPILPRPPDRTPIDSVVTSVPSRRGARTASPHVEKCP